MGWPFLAGLMKSYAILHSIFQCISSQKVTRNTKIDILNVRWTEIWWSACIKTRRKESILWPKTFPFWSTNISFLAIQYTIRRCGVRAFSSHINCVSDCVRVCAWEIDCCVWTTVVVASLLATATQSAADTATATQTHKSQERQCVRRACSYRLLCIG